MKHTVKYVGWTKGEVLGMEVTEGAAPYVPQLKSIVVLEDQRYLVGAIESEIAGTRGMEQEWRIVVKLART